MTAPNWIKQIHYLAAALKAPRITEAAQRLSPPGTGKTQLAIAPGGTTARHGHRVLFATATDRVTRLTRRTAPTASRQKLAKLRCYGLIVVDYIGYLPFKQDATSLFFQLVSSRYEHASLVLTRNLAARTGIVPASWWRLRFCSHWQAPASRVVRTRIGETAVGNLHPSCVLFPT